MAVLLLPCFNDLDFKKVCVIIVYYSRFRPVEQGPQSYFAIVLGVIVYILIGLLHDIIDNKYTTNLEGLPMKTKMKKIFVTIASSVLNSIWSVTTNLLADVLLV